MSDLILPPGVEVTRPEQFPPAAGRGMIVNETHLPDEIVQTYIEEHASVLGLSPGNSYQTYVSQGSLMTRPKFRVPSTIVEEIMLCRDLAERDDDIAATIGAMIALAFGDGMQNAHKDEVTVALFDQVTKHSKLASRMKEMYREWLIAGQVTTATVYSRETFSFTPMGADRARSRSILAPLIAVLPSEQIRVIGNDLFGTASLAYRPFSGRQEQWLMEFFNPQTTAARKAQMRAQDPILTTLLTEQVAWDSQKEGGVSYVYGDPFDPVVGHYVYKLDPQFVARSTMPKGQWPHPRPMMSRNLPLLEAKRLLTIMDYTLLEAGANFLIVAKKGSDQRPALPEEIANLRDTLRRASRSGLMIGDHRLSVEIITPELTELLNPDKRKLIGRKLAAAMLRLPDFTNADGGAGQAGITDTEILSRVIASDRDDLRMHVEANIYDQVSVRNDGVNGAATLWFPKIVLQGLQFFNDMILGLRDRGDIPRAYAVQAAGFNWDAAVAQRRLEKSSGDDKVMTPAAVPFSSPNAGPQDRGGGRPTGAATGANKPTAPGSGKRTVQQNAGETIKAMWDENGDVVRAGELTYRLLEEFAAVRTIGRITKAELGALDEIAQNEIFHPITAGPLTVIPVNAEHAIEDIKAVRLADGLSLLLGRRLEDGAVLTRALVFREPTYSRLDAEEAAMRFGFDVSDPPIER